MLVHSVSYECPTRGTQQEAHSTPPTLPQPPPISGRSCNQGKPFPLTLSPVLMFSNPLLRLDALRFKHPMMLF